MSMRVPSPKDAKTLNIKQYQFLDDLTFIRTPKDVFEESSKAELDEFLAALRHELTEAGWEGDGKIGVIWLPPFVDIGTEDTWGTYVWHVKQSNNGMSWLAADTSLDFRRLREQNEGWFREDCVPTGIMFTACTILQRRVLAQLTALSRRLKALPSRPKEIMTEIRDQLANTAQGQLVSELNYFLDDCYLQVLQEVLDYGNTSKLKLSKFKTSLNPTTYIPDEGESISRGDAESGQWFTTKGLITDIWNSYKFEPFKQKTEMLFKACEYSIPSETQRMITKHVLLRNCIQHHEGGVTADALRVAGVHDFTLLGSRGSKVKLGSGAKISFSVHELFAFAKDLDKLATTFDSHTRQRIRAKHWVKPNSTVT